MNKAQLIDALAERIGDRRTAAAAVDGVVDLVVRAVHRGDKVTISGFGVFEKRSRAARVARNPRTGETVKVKKTNVPAFRPGSNFKDIISGAQKLPKAPSSKAVRGVILPNTRPATAKALPGTASVTTAASSKSASAGSRSAGAKSASAKSTGAKSAGTKSTGSKAASTKSAGAKSASTKSTSTKAASTKAASTKAASGKATATKSTGAKSAAGAKSTSTKAASTKAASTKSAGKKAGSKS